mmetsp:Transcript_31785/g.105269  ORF Transcript_31785/g.105269 Transcript_31785/m.105269 type:complete len:276 (+) Transcript_31785:2045-2872(+)
MPSSAQLVQTNSRETPVRNRSKATFLSVSFIDWIPEATSTSCFKSSCRSQASGVARETSPTKMMPEQALRSSASPKSCRKISTKANTFSETSACTFEAFNLLSMWVQDASKPRRRCSKSCFNMAAWCCVCVIFSKLSILPSTCARMLNRIAKANAVFPSSSKTTDTEDVNLLNKFELVCFSTIGKTFPQMPSRISAAKVLTSSVVGTSTSILLNVGGFLGARPSQMSTEACMASTRSWRSRTKSARVSAFLLVKVAVKPSTRVIKDRFRSFFTGL